MIIERFLSELALRRRSITIFLVLAVFFLPLHFHAAAAAANISHDCACLPRRPPTNGSCPRYPLETIAPLLELFVPLQSLQSHFVSQVVVGFLSIRAPPAFVARSSFLPFQLISE